MAGIRAGFLGGRRNDTCFTSCLVKDYVKLTKFAPKLKYTHWVMELVTIIELGIYYTHEV